MTFSATHPANTLLPGYQPGDYSNVLYRWNYINTGGELGTAAQVSFSFMTERPAYYDGTDYFLNFQAFTSVQMDGARAALALWAEVANLTFTEVADSANGGAGGQMRFGKGDTSYGAYTFYPNALQQGGDVLLSNTATYLDDMTPGTAGFSLMLHEIGHALGLDHSFGNAPNLSDYGIPDTNQYSLMSYTHVARSYIAYYLQNGSSYSYGYRGYLEPETPMVYDIAAVQILYGANTTTRTGDDVYSFDISPVMLRTIWDAGGVDTLDLSNQHRSNIVDLTPGSYSSIGYLADPLGEWPGQVANAFRAAYSNLLDKLYNGQDNLGIAFGTLIENVTGGSGNDQITGNAVANMLRGGSGNDILNGHGGADALDGGLGADSMKGNLGNDTYVVDNAGDIVSELAAHGIDLVQSSVTYTLTPNVEKLTLTGTLAINGTGNGMNNTLQGNSAANKLVGLIGADALNGAAGNDTLLGGAGNDILTGGLGNDFFVFNTVLNATTNIDTLKDYTAVNDTIRLENAIFTSLTTTGVLNVDNFVEGAFALDFNDFILYDNSSGALYYDTDGNGLALAVQFATAYSTGTTPSTLSAAEFVVI